MTGPVKLTPAQQAAGIDRAGESLALRSGAGCGKTFVLARRFTELLLTGGRDRLDDPLARFVALTFTDAAAMEMSQRVRRMMLDFAAKSTGQDKLRWARWIERLSEARISTIHGFCASLLRGLAIQAGLDPAFTVCGDTFVTGKLLSEAAEQAVLRAVEAGDKQTAAMLAGMALESLTRQVRDLLSQRDAVNLADYDDPQATVERWAEAMEHIASRAQQQLRDDAQLRETLAELEGYLCRDPGDKLLPIRDATVRLARGIISGPLAESRELFAELGGDKNRQLRLSQGLGPQGYRPGRARRDKDPARSAGRICRFRRAAQ